MSGVTKRIYDHEIRDIISMWNRQIEVIKPLMPRDFTKDDIISILKRYFPHEWNSVGFKYEYYKIKDKHIVKHYAKPRYNMPKPENLISRVKNYKKLLSINYQKDHSKNYSEETATVYAKALWKKRKPKIERINNKIERAKYKTQQVTPAFLDALIGLYERKSTLQKDKVYILLELKKYYNRKVINFFLKLNDTELNKQLRNEAFIHLQSFNYNPRLRKQQYIRIPSKNKKRRKFLKETYINEEYIIPETPHELEYRIANSKEQKIKTYDYFISHSSKDGIEVQKLINAENQLGKNVFCDWISDVDYLKRHLLCDATIRVLELRIQQSDAVIFVDSGNSRNSIWCKYELNYSCDSAKPIYFISIDSIRKGDFTLNRFSDNWFFDNEYKSNIALIVKNSFY